MNRRNRIIAVLLMICMCISVFSDAGISYAQEVVQTGEPVQAENEAQEDALTDSEEEEALKNDAEAVEENEDDKQTAETVTDAAEKSDDEKEDGQEEKNESEMMSETEEVTEDVDPGSGRLAGNIPAEFYGTQGRIATMASGYTHDSRFASYKKIKGIDVSEWNGSINWSKVKAAGIDYVFVRIGARYSGSGKLKTDSYATTNLKNAAAAGLKVGAYFFSQAITEAEAKQEAQYMLKKIKGYKITMPVVFDFEYYNGGRLDKANLSASKQTKICLAALDTIKSAGYTPMLYANLSMLRDDLYASQISAKYPIWLARYNSYAGYSGDYEFWQYTSAGKVSGISGAVDMNFWYTKTGTPTFGTGSSTASKPTISKPGTVKAKYAGKSYDRIKISWNKVSGASGYIIYRYSPTKKKYCRIKVVNSSTTSYTDTGRSMGKTYKYKVKAYKKASGLTAYGNASSMVKATTSSSMTGKTNGTSVIVRKGPSTKKSKLTKLGINTGVTITGTSGSWYKISIKVKGKKRTGYIKKTYVSIVRKPSLAPSAYSKTQIKLKWSKSSGASGYQIQRYDSKKKKWVRIKTIKSGSTTTYINSGLKSKTTYKYRIRAYKKVRGRNIYSYYCSTKSAKTK